MARVLELSTRIKAVQRSRGDSATAKAAYRACCVIECERENRTHNYARKQGLEAAEIALPSGAPAWAKDRAALWNHAEKRERNGKRGPNANAYKANAQTARDYMFTFPDELSQNGRLKAARIVADHLVRNHGVAVDFAIHRPGREGDERNFHCHMMFTTRRMTAKGLGEKTREWDDLARDGSEEPGLAKQLRAFVAKTINDELKAEGKADLVHVEYRSFKARGVSQKPQIHQGPGKTHQLRKEQAQARRAWFQTMRKDQQERQGKERASLKLRQDFGLPGKLAGIERKHREKADALRRALEQARATDTAPEGLRRIFLIVTGRAGREAFDRQGRDAERVMDTVAKLNSLDREAQAERHAASIGQTQERKELDERHKAEDRQLQQAADARERLDHTAEQEQRREQVQDRQRTQDNERGGRSIGPELN
jgi:MobA/MobL family